MNNYPKRFAGEPDGRWPKDLVEDYRNARSDDDRRWMLLEWGVDDAHQQDAMRLFAPSAADTKPEDSCIDPRIAELQKLRDDVNQYRADEAAYRAAETLRDESAEKRGFWKVVLSAVIAGVIVAIFSYFLPSIVTFFTDFFQKLSAP